MECKEGTCEMAETEMKNLGQAKGSNSCWAHCCQLASQSVKQPRSFQIEPINDTYNVLFLRKVAFTCMFRAWTMKNKFMFSLNMTVFQDH